MLLLYEMEANLPSEEEVRLGIRLAARRKVEADERVHERAKGMGIDLRGALDLIAGKGGPAPTPGEQHVTKEQFYGKRQAPARRAPRTLRRHPGLGGWKRRRR